VLTPISKYNWWVAVLGLSVTNLSNTAVQQEGNMLANAERLPPSRDGVGTVDKAVLLLLVVYVKSQHEYLSLTKVGRDRHRLTATGADFLRVQKGFLASTTKIRISCECKNNLDLLRVHVAWVCSSLVHLRPPADHKNAVRNALLCNAV